MILDRLDIDADSFTAGTGWAIKPEGACKGDLCVPLPRERPFDLVDAADRLGMALGNRWPESTTIGSTGNWRVSPQRLRPARRG